MEPEGKIKEVTKTKWTKIFYHCSTQVQSGSMHSAPADAGDE